MPFALKFPYILNCRIAVARLPKLQENENRKAMPTSMASLKDKWMNSFMSVPMKINQIDGQFYDALLNITVGIL